MPGSSDRTQDLEWVYARYMEARRFGAEVATKVWGQQLAWLLRQLESGGQSQNP